MCRDGKRRKETEKSELEKSSYSHQIAVDCNLRDYYFLTLSVSLTVVLGWASAYSLVV